MIPVLTQLRISLALFESSQKDYEELAISVMSIVDCLVHKTNVNHSLPLISICFLLKKYSFIVSPITVSSLPSLLYLLSTLQEKIESATDILKEILKPIVDGEEEINWPPRDPEALKLMEKVSFCFSSLRKYQCSFG